MILAGADPFAIRAAERELASHDRRIPRDLLVRHYLRQGEIRTLVAKTIAAPPNADEDLFRDAGLEGPIDRANLRFVNPLRTGLYLSGVTLALLAVAFIGRLAFYLRDIPGGGLAVSWLGIVATAAFMVAMCMAYAYIGAYVGRESARKIVSAIAGAAVVVLIFWLAHYLNRPGRPIEDAPIDIRARAPLPPPPDAN
jgi:hypothetical protein